MSVYNSVSGLSIKQPDLQIGSLTKTTPLTLPIPQLIPPKTTLPFNKNQIIKSVNQTKSDWNGFFKTFKEKTNNPKLPDLKAFGSIVATPFLNTLSNKINPFDDDSELGRSLGTLFSSGVSSAGNTIGNNLLKGSSLLNGLSQNVGTSLAGAGAGLVANYIGQGINALGGDSRLSRGIGQGVATGLGTIGGTAASALVQGNNVLGALKSISPVGFGMSVAGAALGAATGPSKEYAGRYGNITQTADTIYDLASVGVNALPGGQLISGAMALNKGLSNIFGSTDGMTVQDAVLGSAFVPAPIKWLNMWGSSKTGSFNRQSWQNTEKTSNFMQNAFGDLQDKFNKAREEAGKTYGTFSQGAKKDAQKNIDFANYAWEKVLAMADQNELQNIRSQDMSSINNQRYAQMIQGGYKPTLIGKQGMKIFNNATNHNIGMRLLSGAALIDNKQMILCSAVD